MIAESEEEDRGRDDDFTGRRGGRGRDDDFTGRRGGRGRDGQNWRDGVRRTDHGQPYWKRSNSNGSGWKRSASAKRQANRNNRRRARDRCRGCDTEEFMDKLMADFYEKFGEDEVELVIADFLNESD